jgi:hypothetical protein
MFCATGLISESKDGRLSGSTEDWGLVEESGISVDDGVI